MLFSVMITGSRDFPIHKAPVIWNSLTEIKKEIGDGEETDWGWAPHRVVFHHGECPFGGADLIGASWAAGAGWKVIPHPPKQRTGYYYNLRNQQMVDLKPNYVLACFLQGAKNRGTQNTVDMVKAAGLEDRLRSVFA